MDQKLDLKKVMTYEELQHFFSQTAEFEIVKKEERHGNPLYEITFEEKASVFISQPTIQTLIRTIYQLQFNVCNGIS